MRKVTVLSLLLLALLGCDFQQQANQQFGDQHFKTAISLVELHKTRFGTYPDTLKDLKFIGDWDVIAIQSVTYKKLDTGYRLEVTNGWIGKPELNYPEEFWQGLGITNRY